tara:strand:- start:447 stop:737 length:291 start_codon:yes stop_codon:yes gene_type:complete
MLLQGDRLVLFTVNIPNKAERTYLASQIKKILKNADLEANVYTPIDKSKADIGIKAENLSLKTLAQIVGRIEQSGYSIDKKGQEDLDLSVSALSPQ